MRALPRLGSRRPYEYIRGMSTRPSISTSTPRRDSLTCTDHAQLTVQLPSLAHSSAQTITEQHAGSTHCRQQCRSRRSCGPYPRILERRQRKRGARRVSTTHGFSEVGMPSWQSFKTTSMRCTSPARFEEQAPVGLSRSDST